MTRRASHELPRDALHLRMEDQAYMFHHIPTSVQERMDYLEAIDARDRTDGTPRAQRMRQVPPETGRFIALLAASAPAGAHLETGTSAGYSALWLALACRETGRRPTTFEALPAKAALADERVDALMVPTGKGVLVCQKQ